MLLSMTGFSSINIILTHEKRSVPVAMTLKTLNSRFFEFNCKLPSAFSQLETYLIKEFKQKLHRGNVYFTLTMQNTSELGNLIKPSLSTITNYLDSIEKIKKNFKIQGSITINDLINLPNVFEIEEMQLSDKLHDNIKIAIEKLINDVIKKRTEEGKALEKDIKQRINLLKKYLKNIELESKRVLQLRKEEINKALKDVTAQVDQKVINETVSSIIYNQLDKIDIHEEIIRIKWHLENLINTIGTANQEIGKKIDFTVQELFREINTIASKCNDATISDIAINIKIELEKMREQSQNIV